MLNLFSLPFLQNALLTGTCVAIVSALVGYFLIARSLTFAGHALSHIGFAGAAGAVLLGLSPLTGMLVFTIGAGVGISLISKESRSRDLAIGIILTAALSLGILFLSLYSGYAERVYAILFGDILGISQTDMQVTALFAAITVVVLIALFRPLLFSSFDSDVAEARGVPVRSCGWLSCLSSYRGLNVGAGRRYPACVYSTRWASGNRNASLQKAPADHWVGNGAGNCLCVGGSLACHQCCQWHMAASFLYLDALLWSLSASTSAITIME